MGLQSLRDGEMLNQEKVKEVEGHPLTMVIIAERHGQKFFVWAYVCMSVVAFK